MWITELIHGILLHELGKQHDRDAQRGEDLGCSPKLMFMLEERAHKSWLAFDSHARSLGWEWSW